MAILLKPLPCPACNQSISKRQLQSSGQLKAFLNSKEFACPHCQGTLQYPENGDRLLSLGILVAVFIAPLLQYWNADSIAGKVAFGIGAAMTITGIVTQKIDFIKAAPDTTQQDEERTESFIKTYSAPATFSHIPVFLIVLIHLLIDSHLIRT